MNKRQHGQYFTKQNPFVFNAFKEWFYEAQKNNQNHLLEPFSGVNHIPILIDEALNQNLQWDCYDIDPSVIPHNLTDFPIVTKDVFKQFPQGHTIVITNPPYLAKNSATRRGLDFPDTDFTDLYLFSLQKCLDNADYVAAIIPESFIVQNLFHNRLSAVISLTMKMFDDTECPVCLALFVPNKTDLNFKIYNNDVFIGDYLSLKSYQLETKEKVPMIFNSPDGEIAIYAVDNNKEDSIYFDHGKTLLPEKIKHTSRAYSRIKLNYKFTTQEINDIIILSNQLLNESRAKTNDVFLTAFKGLRKDGKYRRRLDFKQVRNIISIAIFSLYPEYKGRNE